jgi:HAD superfamily hydrolase (TIGR01459 family)
MRFLSYISNMTKNLDATGLKSIANSYDLFFIDIWGVVHNGINLNKPSIEVLENLSNLNKEFVLLTNAPRPNITVINFLEKMGLNKNFFKNVFTSGEAALKYLIKDLKNKKFFHIGPPRDFDLFKSFKENKVSNINESDYLLCSGLFDDLEDLNYYKNLLIHHISKKMICTNPDLIVDRGENREYCAGSIAKIFEEINGEVIYFGKPYPPVYNLSSDTKDKKILCIGDNLNTDIRGANIQNYDSLLITSGIHRQEISKLELNNVIEKYSAKVDYSQTDLKW